MKRIAFLPAFFIVLSALLLVAILFRVRSYRTEDVKIASPTTSIVPEVPEAAPSPSPVEGEIPQSSAALPDQTTVEESSSPRAPLMPAVTATVPQDEIQRIVQAVWFDPIEVQTGQSDALHLRVAPNARVDAITGTLQNASRSARLPFTCSSGQDSIWNCRLTVPSCVACGRWRIERLEIAREATIMYVPSSHPVLGSMIRLSGERCDSAPPALNAVTVNDAGDGSNDFVLMLTVADGYCGVAAISGTAVSSRGQRLTFTGIPAGDEHTWSARVDTSSSTDRGNWRVSSIEVSDAAGNFKLYSDADSILRNTAFVVP